MSQRDEAAPSYKLIYFDGRSRAETTRLIFAAAGVPYEDYRVKDEEWPKLKPNTPFGCLPVLQIGKKMLSESHAIEHYLARQYGLAGKTHYEQACVNMLVLAIEGLNHHFDAIFGEENDAKKVELVKKYEEARDKPLNDLVKILKTESKKPGHFVGNDLTYADLGFFNFADLQTAFGATEVDWKLYPDLQKVFDTVKNYPKVKEYLAGRPVQPF